MLSFIFANKNKYNMDKIELLHGDCLDKMSLIPDKSVDFICTDLPYGVTANKLDIIIPFDLLWKKYNRIIKDDGCIALFAQGLFYVDLVNSNRSMFRYDLIWNKVLSTGFLNAKRQPLRSHEQIAIFYKKQPVYNPQMTEGMPLHSKGNSFKDKDCTNNNYGKFKNIESNTGSTLKYPKSIISFQKPHPSKSVHRTEKSIECIEYLINTYTNENAVVLDSTMGSGTTGVACINTNRNFIGIELDDKYFDIAKTRISETVKQHYDKGELDERVYNSLINFNV